MDIVKELRAAEGEAAPLLKAAADEIERLRHDCSEAYLAVGEISGSRLPFDHPDVERTLDNLYAAAAGEPRPHEDLRPFRGK